jgi:hypothetical protein
MDKYQDIGKNLIQIYNRLIANEDLCKLIYYTDKDPLSHTNIPDKTVLFENEIRIVPRVGPIENDHSKIVTIVTVGHKNENPWYSDIAIKFGVYVPLTQWIIKNENLRPFLIIDNLVKSLNGKKIEGLGTMNGGEFALSLLTEEVSCYDVVFYLTL